MDLIAKTDTALLLEIAEDAGEAILEIYKTEDFSTITEKKGDNSPLTLADRASHNIILKGLRANFPDIPVLSEEGADIPYETRKNWKRFWLVDPLDGTKEFLKRNGEFTVNIALIESGRAVMGVVYVPVLKKMYWNEYGGPAFVRNESGDMRKLEVNTYSPALSGLRFVTSRSHLSPEVEKYLGKFTSPEKISMGSSLKFMIIAEGGAENYPRLGPTMEWDTAAAQSVLEAAGGKVVISSTGEPLRYNKENLLNPFFIASARTDGDLPLEDIS